VTPAPFDYLRAESVDHAVELLGEHGDDAKLLAGGHSLLPMMKLRLATPMVLVDVGRLHDLRYVRDGGDHLAIGALTRHHDLETDPLIARDCPLLAHVAHLVGDRQVRHRGTLGGTLAHGDPAGDLPAVALALDATLVVTGPGGTRDIPATQLYESFLETAIEPDELLVEVRVPKVPTGWNYQKFVRRAQDWAIVGVAAARVGDRMQVAMVNMGSTTLRATAVEEALAGGATTADAAELAAEGTAAPEDLNGSAAYREHLARVLTRRAIDAALG
jgi:carbon-monoxide dehydrogenase medium subunit